MTPTVTTPTDTTPTDTTPCAVILTGAAPTFGYAQSARRPA